MSDVSSGAGAAPWLEEDHPADKGATTVTATVIEGAEVVRTAAVSYATPILHQVFIQGSPSSLPQTSVSPAAAPAASGELKTLRVGVAPPGTAAILPFRDILIRNDDEENMAKENPSVSPSSYLVCSSSSSSSPSPSVPLWVFSSSLLSSNSVVLRPVTPGASVKQSSPLEVSSVGGGSGGSPIGVSFLPSPSSFSFCSSSSSSSSSSATPSPILSPFPSAAKSGTKNDDELTSLSWLQDSNLLLGTALSPIKPQSSSKVGESNSSEDRKRSHKRARKDGVSVAGGRADDKKESLRRPQEGVEEEFKLESPTSDYGEDTSETSSDSPEAVHTSNGNVPSNSSRSQPIPYNPKVHVKAKPPFSFSCLIFMAIEESPTKALPVKDIYSWILDHYPYYRSAPTGWKNSVRHNLSLNKCFSKVEKAPNLGKGSLWMVDPTFRPNLLQAMSKTPFTSQSGIDKNYGNSNKAFINTKYLYGLTSKTPEKVITLGDFVVQNEVEVLPSSTTMTTHTQPSNNIKVEEEDPLSLMSSYSLPGSSPIQMDRTLSRHPADESTDVAEGRHSEPIKMKGRNPNNPYTPNPELFPRLAKRLESHSAEMGGTQFETTPIEVQSEDVDAAAAMLVLKHGPRMLSPYHENYNHVRESPEMNYELFHNDCNTRSHNNSESSDSGSVVISSSPSQDHAYVIKGNGGRKVSEAKVGTHSSGVERGQGMKSKNTSPTSSVDEAFYDDSFENEMMSDPPLSTPQLKRPFEEADALLNLAAVATSLASRQEILEEGGITLPQAPFNCIESQASHSETQVKTQDYSPQPKRLKYNQSSSQSPSEISKPNRKLVKRKSHTNLKASASKKITDILSSNLTTHNNNNHNVINRNKLLKVRKILKIRKSRC